MEVVCLMAACTYGQSCGCNESIWINTFNEMWPERLNCILCDGLTLRWCFLYCGVMRNELGVDIELRGVSICDVSQGI